MNAILNKYIRALVVLWKFLGIFIIACILFPETAFPQNTEQDKRQLVHPSSTNSFTVINQKRVALVIGNSKYEKTSHLKNPGNDARDVAASLREIGFEVLDDTNCTAQQMMELINQFRSKLSRGGIGLFYYAGHGVQVSGKNYMIPVDADIFGERSIEYEAIDVGRVLAAMEDAQSSVNIVILDACRTNPFQRGWRSSENGWAKVDAPDGTIIAYATKPGSVASDNKEARNGLYTTELLRYIKQSGLTVEQMFKKVRAGVKEQSGGKQIPWEDTSFTGEFYFVNSTVAPVSIINNVVTPEQSFWESIKNSSDAEDFKAYLTKFPNGNFVALAQNSLRRLETPPKSRRKTESSGNQIENHSSISKEIRKRSSELAQKGESHRMKGEYEAAIRDLTEAIRLDPLNVDAYWSRSDSHRLIGKFDLAILDSTLVIQHQPQNSRAYGIRGVAYFGKKEYELALSDLSEAIRLEPKYYWTYYGRAQVYHAIKKPDLAKADEERELNDLTAEIQSKSTDARTYLDRCNYYRMRAQLDLALADCNQAIQLSNRNALAFAARGDVYRLKGNYDRALVDLTEAIRLDTNYWWAYDRRAEAYESLGLKEPALADRRKSEEIQNKK